MDCRDALQSNGWDIVAASKDVLRGSSKPPPSSTTASVAADATRSSTDDEVAMRELEGYLNKRSNFWKTWRKRYIVLQGAHLLSYVDAAAAQSDGDNPKDVFKLGPQSNVRQLESPSRAFAVTLADGKEVVFSADSPSVYDLWMKCIRNAVEAIRKMLPATITNAGSSSSASPAAMSLSPKEEAELLVKLEGMGFTAQQARVALTKSGGHIDRAVELLLGGGAEETPGDVGEVARVGSTKEQSDIERAIQASLREAGTKIGAEAADGRRSSEAVSSNREKMMEIRLPYDAIPGQTMQVKAPNGRSYTVTIPSPIPPSRRIHMAYE